jgi:quercetin dioxygenase-like cupin family protein
MDIKDISQSIEFNDTTFTKRVLYADKDILSFVLNFKPGQALPVHKHENSSLVLNVLSGSGEVKVNDEVAKISKGSLVYAKGQDNFSVPTVNENMTLHVSLSPNPSNEMYAKKIG